MFCFHAVQNRPLKLVGAAQFSSGISGSKNISPIRAFESDSVAVAVVKRRDAFREPEAPDDPGSFNPWHVRCLNGLHDHRHFSFLFSGF
jgi:hypothetical protein